MSTGENISVCSLVHPVYMTIVKLFQVPDDLVTIEPKMYLVIKITLPGHISLQNNSQGLYISSFMAHL